MGNIPKMHNIRIHTLCYAHYFGNATLPYSINASQKKLYLKRCTIHMLNVKHNVGEWCKICRLVYIEKMFPYMFVPVTSHTYFEKMFPYMFVPVTSFCKIFIPSNAFDALLCWNWLFSSPNCLTLQITLISFKNSGCQKKERKKEFSWETCQRTNNPNGLHHNAHHQTPESLRSFVKS